MPAYNCGTEVDAILHSGAKTKGYSVERSGVVDLEDLESRVTARTKAVYVIHYFGWEQPLKEIRRMCDARRLALIEDCALALFSTGPSGSLGCTGDAVIFSLPKTLGSLHGGLLSLPATSSRARSPSRPAGSLVLAQEVLVSAKALLVNGLDRFGGYGVLRSWSRAGRTRIEDPGIAGLPAMPANYYFNQGIDGDRSPHPRLLAAAGFLDWSRTVRARRENFLRLMGDLRGIRDVAPLHSDLPDGICPLSFPILVPERDRFASLLRARGIAAIPWWAGFHSGGIDWAEFPDAIWLKNTLMTLPVHEGLDEAHLAHIVESVSAVSKIVEASSSHPR